MGNKSDKSKKSLSPEEIGILSRELLKDKGEQKFYCNPPTPCISKDKPVIIFIGMNPAGGKDDAERDKKTEGLFLNYYEEFDDEESGLSDVIKDTFTSYKYFYPVLEFFKGVIGEVLWEWCNYDNIDNLCKRIEAECKQLNDEKEKDRLKNCLEKCKNKYTKEATYQVIMRDLVYYHHSNGNKFKKLLIGNPTPDKLVSKNPKKTVRDVMEQLIDYYIDMVPDKSQIKLIYASSSVTCKFVSCLNDDKDLNLKPFGGFYYKGIPILLAGRALSGAGVTDDYSKVRLQTAVEYLLK